MLRRWSHSHVTPLVRTVNRRDGPTDVRAVLIELALDTRIVDRINAVFFGNKRKETPCQRRVFLPAQAQW
jgi:hypothetical protein